MSPSAEAITITANSPEARSTFTAVDSLRRRSGGHLMQFHILGISCVWRDDLYRRGWRQVDRAHWSHVEFGKGPPEVLVGQQITIILTSLAHRPVAIIRAVRSSSVLVPHQLVLLETGASEPGSRMACASRSTLRLKGLGVDA